MKRKNFMLTEHFSYNEMTRSTWAETHRVDNTPDALQLAALENLCHVLLEPLRRQFGPIRINSGFRSPEVNEGVGGVGCSKHLSGEAMDIYPRIATMPPAEQQQARESLLRYCELDTYAMVKVLGKLRELAK